ncbi:MAG: WbqC family protein [Thiotrichaceae bacterium]|nr:WbqC family protein [Thiotrichaceae bacterium]
MKLAIMQPYFLPYIGYFQLIYAVDKFIILDDVNYIKKGWINRNRMLLDHQAHLFTLPLQKSSQNRKIHELKLVCDIKWQTKLLKKFELSYKKAPHFDLYPMFQEIINYPQLQLSDYIFYSLQRILDYLDVQTELVKSSNIYQNQHLKAQDRIIDICQQEQAKTYINLMGGQLLYDKDTFENAGIQLQFIETKPIIYKQFNNEFIQHLSVIDLLMFNSIEQTQYFLNQYQLI